MSDSNCDSAVLSTPGSPFVPVCPGAPIAHHKRELPQHAMYEDEFTDLPSEEASTPTQPSNADLPRAASPFTVHHMENFARHQPHWILMDVTTGEQFGDSSLFAMPSRLTSHDEARFGPPPPFPNMDDYV